MSWQDVAKELGFNPLEMREGALASHRPAWEEIVRLRELNEMGAVEVNRRDTNILQSKLAHSEAKRSKLREALEKFHSPKEPGEPCLACKALAADLEDA